MISIRTELQHASKNLCDTKPHLHSVMGRCQNWVLVTPETLSPKLYGIPPLLQARQDILKVVDEYSSKALASAGPSDWGLGGLGGGGLGFKM